MITRVTITGADHSVHPTMLHQLSEEYPFVEWGILFSITKENVPRYPHYEWVYLLYQYAKDYGPMNLSAHVCGRYVRWIAKGERQFFDHFSEYLPVFGRIQLNGNYFSEELNQAIFDILHQYADKDFIFQQGPHNDLYAITGMAQGIKTAILFDKSGGNGISPDSWQAPYKSVPCGYAGGLSPENLDEQIQRIEEKAGSTPIWIDMETHVRSDNDRQFDLAKVRTCLEIASKYVTVPA